MQKSVRHFASLSSGSKPLRWQSVQSLSPGSRTKGGRSRANWRLRASNHSSVHGPRPEVMSPMCAMNAGSWPFSSSIARSRRSTSDAEYGVSPIRTKATPPAGGWAAQPASSSNTENLYAVSLAQERQGMRFHCITGFLSHSLHDVPCSDRAIGADVVGRSGGHLAEHRPADLHRLVEVLGLHAPGAVVTRAALDHRHLGARHALQHLARLLAHVLHAGVAGDVVGDFSEWLLEVAF